MYILILLNAKKYGCDQKKSAVIAAIFEDPLFTSDLAVVRAKFLITADFSYPV
jgi:hypothetical protein